MPDLDLGRRNNSWKNKSLSANKFTKDAASGRDIREVQVEKLGGRPTTTTIEARQKQEQTPPTHPACLVKHKGPQGQSLVSKAQSEEPLFLSQP